MSHNTGLNAVNFGARTILEALCVIQIVKQNLKCAQSLVHWDWPQRCVLLLGENLDNCLSVGLVVCKPMSIDGEDVLFAALKIFAILKPIFKLLACLGLNEVLTVCTHQHVSEASRHVSSFLHTAILEHFARLCALLRDINPSVVCLLTDSQTEEPKVLFNKFTHFGCLGWLFIEVYFACCFWILVVVSLDILLNRQHVLRLVFYPSKSLWPWFTLLFMISLNDLYNFSIIGLLFFYSLRNVLFFFRKCDQRNTFFVTIADEPNRRTVLVEFGVSPQRIQVFARIFVIPLTNHNSLPFAQSFQDLLTQRLWSEISMFQGLKWLPKSKSA